MNILEHKVHLLIVFFVWTAKFQQAVTEGDYQAVRRALNSSKRYDVEALDDLGITLLMYAAQSGKFSSCDPVMKYPILLCETWIYANMHNYNKCFFYHTITAGFDDIAELLVSNGGDINAQQKNGTTSLMLACEHVSN